MPEIQLSQGPIHYRDEGSGPVVMFIHGLLVNGRVWDPVVQRVSSHARCIVPDLPLGSHRSPMHDNADLSPAGVAHLIAEMIDRLELEQVTLVGNDTGGALCQLVAVDHRERLGGLVLVNCDAFDNFPPRAFRPVVRALARVPGAVAALDLLGRLRPVRQASMKLAPLTVDPVPDELLRAWISPLHDRGVRRDLVRVLRGLPANHTLAASHRLGEFDRPALVVWGLRDGFFPLSDAERLTAAIPAARLERIENARTFVQLDAPDRLAELITSFVSETAPAPRPAAPATTPPAAA